MYYGAPSPGIFIFSSLEKCCGAVRNGGNSRSAFFQHPEKKADGKAKNIFIEMLLFSRLLIGVYDSIKAKCRLRKTSGRKCLAWVKQGKSGPEEQEEDGAKAGRSLDTHVEVCPVSFHYFPTRTKESAGLPGSGAALRKTPAVMVRGTDSRIQSQVVPWW